MEIMTSHLSDYNVENFHDIFLRNQVTPKLYFSLLSVNFAILYIISSCAAKVLLASSDMELVHVSRDHQSNPSIILRWIWWVQFAELRRTDQFEYFEQEECEVEHSSISTKGLSLGPYFIPHFLQNDYLKHLYNLHCYCCSPHCSWTHCHHHPKSPCVLSSAPNHDLM